MSRAESTSWLRTQARQTGQELRAADRRLLLGAAGSALSGAVYVATGLGPFLAASIISACLLALLSKGDAR